MKEGIASLKQRASELRAKVHALYLACKDPRVSWYARAFALCVAAYAFSPIDLIPDFIPVIGYLDDLIVVPLGIFLAIKMIPAAIFDECREKAREAGDRKRPVSWTPAFVIVSIWTGCLLLILKWITKS